MKRYRVLMLLTVLLTVCFGSAGVTVSAAPNTAAGRSGQADPGNPAVSRKQPLRPDASLLQPAIDSVEAYLRGKAVVYGRIRVQEVSFSDRRTLTVRCNRTLSEYPIRDKDVRAIYTILRNQLPRELQRERIVLYAEKTRLEDLSSPYYSGRQTLASEPARRSRGDETRPWVTPASRPYRPSAGLQDRHIALWQSHGLYYEQSLMRWEWQRARIFQTVEDLYTQSYVLPFLVPMLENAGACVTLPRERDTNTEELIVDNDGAPFSGSSRYRETSGAKAPEWKECTPGFAGVKETYLQGENPFRLGTARYVRAVRADDEAARTTAKWIPAFPKSGEYAVYVSYATLPHSTDCARYTVRHAGGETDFLVNQQMGGGTWVYLGTFFFSAESVLEQGVFLTNAVPDESYRRNAVVSADAVKFGGGMGNIARRPDGWDDSLFTLEPETSGYPRYTEGARYWLQWAGFPEDVYSSTENRNDYQDDYVSRGRWVNYLSSGSRMNPADSGLCVPLDLAMAFHSDAGTTLDDTMVGTLAIYTRFKTERKKDQDLYPTGEPRQISRELADLIQTQIVDDVRATFDEEWPRRGLWDRSYSESRSPDVPTMLLELLSHQNFADMRYGLDPRFKFTVSRAVYKGMLRFLSLRDGTPYVVQPLPVRAFAADLVYADASGTSGTPASSGMSGTPSSSGNAPAMAVLSWQPVSDPLEPTADPDRYLLYTAVSEPGEPLGGFDNGRIVEGTSVSIPLEPGRIYSFRIAALNDGGASFPSETLSVGLAGRSKRSILIINGFDRISAPVSYATRDTSRAGFVNCLDGGVPYGKEYAFIGRQHEFRRRIPWMDDDAPGFGASYGNYENRAIAGNTFDYPFRHGAALLKAGYDFASASRDAVSEGRIDLQRYAAADVILGKQVTTETGRDGQHSGLKGAGQTFEAFPPAFRQALTRYARHGGRLLVSGAYVGTDLWDSLSGLPPQTASAESREVRELIGQLDGITGSLDRVLEGMRRRLDDNLRRNDSLGFSYFTTDSTLLEQTEALYRQAKTRSDSLRNDLRRSQQALSALDHGSDARALGQDFARDILRYRWMTNYASAEGTVRSAPNPYGFRIDGRYEFHTRPDASSYAVESPDGIVPVGPDAWTILRYADNNISAGVAYRGPDYRSVVLGFPVEALTTDAQVEDLLRQVFAFLLGD